MNAPPTPARHAPQSPSDTSGSHRSARDTSASPEPSSYHPSNAGSPFRPTSDAPHHSTASPAATCQSSPPKFPEAAPPNFESPPMSHDPPPATATACPTPRSIPLPRPSTTAKL